MSPTIKDTVTELQFKLQLIDRQLSEIQRDYSRSDVHIADLHEKVEKIKDEINSVKRINLDDLKLAIKSIEKEISDLQVEIDTLKLEMPEMRLIKKIVLGLVAFILTAFLGLLWNTVINPVSKKSNDNVDEIVKKISQEYQRKP